MTVLETRRRVATLVRDPPCGNFTPFKIHPFKYLANLQRFIAINHTLTI